MDLKQLEYFVRVAELSSFTRAAHAIGIAQPALSRQVRLLEVELRQNLLLRNGRGATPTEAGQLLLDHARGILHQVERAREDLGRVRGALAGRVAIGLPPTLARVLTVPLTRAFRRELPEAQLSISEGLSTGMQEGLIQGRLDLALLYDAAALPELEIQPLFEELLLLVQARPPGLLEDPPALPIALREIAAIPLVIPSRPNAIRMHVERELAGLGLRPTIALEIDGVPHPRPGGRRHGQRRAAAQRRLEHGPAFGLHLARDHRPGPEAACHACVERTAPRDAHAAGRGPTAGRALRPDVQPSQPSSLSHQSRPLSVKKETAVVASSAAALMPSWPWRCDRMV